MGKIYPVGIVGESNYQPAIRKCRAGQTVDLVLEPGNPYDAKAIAVVSEFGDTIGYIARDSFVRDLVHVEEQLPSATIKSIARAGSGNLGVVIDVDIDGDAELETRAFIRDDDERVPAKSSGIGKHIFAVIGIGVLLLLGKCIS